MGVLPINRLLLSMSLPMMASMLVQALYNIVDAYFVAQYSDKAMAAVTLAMPVQNLMIAVAVGTGVGVNSLLSRSLGEKNQKAVNSSAMNGLFLAVITGIVFAVGGFFLSEPFIMLQKNDPGLVQNGAVYLQICTVGGMGVFVQIMFERLLLSTGKTMFVMISQATGAIVNIVLDPIMIFGRFGFPEMGAAGAALATIIGQWCGMGLAIFLNHKMNHEVKLHFRGFRPSLSMIKKIYAVGLPSIIMQAVGSVMTFGMNQILIRFSETAVTLFGIYFRLQSFVFMPVFGLNNGMVPIVAYNYGAQNKKRITKVIRYSIFYAVGIMCLGVILFQVFPRELLEIFNASPELLKIGVPALRIISIHFLLAGFCIVMGSVFQALGNGVFSLINSVSRQLIVLLPAAYLLANIFGLHAVWFSFFAAEVVSLCLSILFFRVVYRRKIAPIPDTKPATEQAGPDAAVSHTDEEISVAVHQAEKSSAS